MINVLGVGLDYLWLKGKNTRGGYKFRLLEYGEKLGSLVRILYSPQKIKLNYEKYGNNIDIFYTCSMNKLLFPIDAIKITNRIIKNKKIDIITAEDPFLGGFTGVLIKWIFKIPLNIQIDHDRINNAYWIKEKWTNYFKNIFANFIINRADSLRVMSQRTRERLIASGVEKNKIWVVPTPIDVTEFTDIDSDLLRTNLLGTRFNKIVFFLGRLSQEKNIPFLIKAFSYIIHQYSSVLLLIAGEGKEEINLKKMVNHLNLEKNVLFTGAVEYKKVPEYFKASDIFVLPSLHEGRANVLIEAALAKKPIVSTDVGGAREVIIDRKTGFIIEQMNHRQLTDKILFLLNNPKIAQKFGEDGFSFVKENLQETNEAIKLIQCWEETAKIKAA
ncbi:MAG: glycosyltransferase family 4 protein [Candidatus Omnitrophica bacterium]|nr:glycosyltransferase family 4 protein [Candidatus Omnitrophota bacterium]